MPNEEAQEAQEGSHELEYVTLYVELCKSYHRLKDFRAKLLGFLPLSSATGISLLLDSDIDKAYLSLIGIFGLLVTIGLYTYEVHGNQLLEQLFLCGEKLEDKLADQLDYKKGKPAINPSITKYKGQFSVRPVDGLASNDGAERAAKIIYYSVALAWICIMFIGFGHLIYILYTLLYK